jgi:hypothetical protein
MSRELFRLVGVWSGCWVVRVYTAIGICHASYVDCLLARQTHPVKSMSLYHCMT